MSAGKHEWTFGRRKEPHTVIIARGDRFRYFNLRPWMLGAATALATTLTVGYFGATAYLFMRDDLLSAAVEAQDSVRDRYETRIAALRAELDRVTSKQMLGQRLVETKVVELLKQQRKLAERHAKLQPLLDQARSSGLLPEPIPVPTPKPTLASGTPPVAETGVPSLAAGNKYARFEAIGFSPSEHRAALPFDAVMSATAMPGETQTGAESASRPLSGTVPELVEEIRHSIDTVEERQLAQLQALLAGAMAKKIEISAALEAEGIRQSADEQAMGGLYVPEGNAFETGVEALQVALGDLQQLNRETAALPLRRPLEDGRVTSRFGSRRDPFLGRRAFHTGMDFAARAGTPVRAPADGTVVYAGRKGGYGNVVEIEHGDGLKTRFAHLSEIAVEVGEHIEGGARLGAVGTTGRSTGPHLHYEIRRGGRPVDPAPYLRAGTRIAAYL